MYYRNKELYPFDGGACFHFMQDFSPGSFRLILWPLIGGAMRMASV
jgi:hypothetical protein